MSILLKSSRYRKIATVTLLVLVSGIALATYDRFPEWWKAILTSNEDKYPSETILTHTAKVTEQPRSSSDEQTDSTDEMTDIFAMRTWEPPLAPPPPPAPAPPPVAPQLPFKFMGRIVDQQKETAFLLLRGKELVQVSVGDSIDGIYHVEKYENGQLYFLYQPLNILQTLFVGSDS